MSIYACENKKVSFVSEKRKSKWNWTDYPIKHKHKYQSKGKCTHPSLIRRIVMDMHWARQAIVGSSELLQRCLRQYQCSFLWHQEGPFSCCCCFFKLFGHHESEADPIKAPFLQDPSNREAHDTQQMLCALLLLLARSLGVQQSMVLAVAGCPIPES